MTRYLYLARHADAVSDPMGNDFQRPLSEDGLANARLMGTRIKENGVQPSAIYTSPAVRARTTAEIFAEVLAFPAEGVQNNINIYEATARALQDIVAGLSNSLEQVMIIGHNPAVSRVVGYYTSENMENIPPAGIVCLCFGDSNWADAKMNSATFEWYDFPQNAILNNVLRT